MHKSGLVAFFFLIFILLVSCVENKEIVYEYKNIKNALWDKEDIVTFEVPVTDTLSRFDVFVDIRNDNSYPYKNIWLLISLKDTEGQIQKDTINVPLADDFGKWLGKKGLSLYEKEKLFKTIQFPRKGTYIYSVQHGMRREKLEGINDVGIRIIPNASGRSQ